MNAFDLFVSKYPPGNDLRKPTIEMLEQFQGKLPAELLDFWQKYGFGNYGGGLLKIIDPTDYMDTLTLWLGEQEDCFPILMTGFGTLFIYRRLSETADDMCLLDIHYRRSGSFSAGFSDFFERILPAENFAEQFLRVDLFQEASAKHGGLAENEIFFFAPALAFGGAESIQYIEKGNAVVHQHLLFEMGAGNSGDAEPDDMWSQAYEANPHVFELENGGLMVSFTLSETVDTILPAAPETLYEIEGETVSLWALTFISLTKEENLGFLEYHKALQRLQPCILETRGDYLLLRGLSLAEMECVLSEE
ncbi:MAG TPA: DUF1851 domain-containing protein [Firmicutes bacterium]|nr:DUF1851 domain-containing protein [Bacillota bacterium]